MGKQCLEGTIIRRDTVTARNTEQHREGTGKKRGQVSLLLPSNFLTGPPIGKAYPKLVGKETGVIQQAPGAEKRAEKKRE